jgi:hypothetical protein
VTGRQRDGPRPATRPANGWLSVERGVVGIQRTPPASETIHVALQAAALTAHAQPSPELLDWFATRRHVALTWDKSDTATLVRFLRAHQPAGW